MEKKCGFDLPNDVLSTSNIVKLEFVTDGSNAYSGWNVSWSAVTPGSLCPPQAPPTPGQPCNQLPEALDCYYKNLSKIFKCCCDQCDVDMTCVLNSSTGSGVWQKMHSTLCPAEGCGSEGVVTSPGFPGKYPSNLNTRETIQVEEGLVVYLHFDAFEIQGGDDCPYDYPTIMDSDGTTLMEKTCGTNQPKYVLSTSNIVKLEFVTDSRTAYSGWNVSWSAVTAGSVCPFPTL